MIGLLCTEHKKGTTPPFVKTSAEHQNGAHAPASERTLRALGVGVRNSRITDRSRRKTTKKEQLRRWMSFRNLAVNVDGASIPWRSDSDLA
jgi:hypothetical protein